MAELLARITVAAKFVVNGYAVDGILISFNFVLAIDGGQFIEDSLREFKWFSNLLRPILDSFNGYLVHFELVQALAVLVDQINDILQKLIEGFAFEIEADEIARIVTVRSEHFL